MDPGGGDLPCSTLPRFLCGAASLVVGRGLGGAGDVLCLITGGRRLGGAVEIFPLVAGRGGLGRAGDVLCLAVGAAGHRRGRESSTLITHKYRGSQ